MSDMKAAREAARDKIADGIVEDLASDEIAREALDAFLAELSKTCVILTFDEFEDAKRKAESDAAQMAIMDVEERTP